MHQRESQTRESWWQVPDEERSAPEPARTSGRERGIAAVVIFLAVAALLTWSSGMSSSQLIDRETRLLDDAEQSSEDGRFDDAIASLTELIESNPAELLTTAHYRRAISWESLGRPDEVRLDLRRIVSLRSANDELRRKAEQWLRELGEDE